MWCLWDPAIAVMHGVLSPRTGRHRTGNVSSCGFRDKSLADGRSLGAEKSKRIKEWMMPVVVAKQWLERLSSSGTLLK